jgi:hypothetical protein
MMHSLQSQTRTNHERKSSRYRWGVDPAKLLELEMLGLRSLIAGKEKAMNVWSDYLEAQAILADRISKIMTTAASRSPHERGDMRGRQSRMSPRSCGLRCYDATMLRCLS